MAILLHRLTLPLLALHATLLLLLIPQFSGLSMCIDTEHIMLVMHPVFTKLEADWSAEDLMEDLDLQ